MDQQWRKVQPLLADIPGLLHWQISHSHQSQDDIISAIIENGLIWGLSMLRQCGALLLSSGVLDESHQRICKKR